MKLSLMLGGRESIRHGHGKMTGKMKCDVRKRMMGYDYNRELGKRIYECEYMIV